MKIYDEVLKAGRELRAETKLYLLTRALDGDAIDIVGVFTCEEKALAARKDGFKGYFIAGIIPDRSGPGSVWKDCRAVDE